MKSKESQIDATSSWIDLGEPAPRPEVILYKPYSWPAIGIIDITEEYEAPDIGFFDVVNKRRTYRDLERIDIPKISEIMSLLLRTRFWGDDSLGFSKVLRPVPSAGAIHPIHVLVSSPTDEHWLRYLPDHHVFECLDPAIINPADVRISLGNINNVSNATILLFIAEPGKTAAKYSHESSLVWRDAGFLQGFFALVSQALGLGYCPIGLTGEIWAKKLDEKGRLAGVGLGYIGTVLPAFGTIDTNIRTRGF